MAQSTQKYTGEMLLSAARRGKNARSARNEDPVVLGFLRFLESQMTVRPDQIVAADRAQLARIGKLVRGVKPG